MKSLTKFGTYGFLSALLAAQVATSPALFADGSLADKADRAGVDAKKTGRAMKRDAKKAGRQATGQDNAWDDAKDSVGDAGKNVKDEVDYQKRKSDRND